MKKSVERKYCPRCGTPARFTDSYCIKCGYRFNMKKNKKPLNLKTIIIGIIIVAGLWVVFRLLAKKPIIPEVLSNLTKSFFQNKTR